MRSTTALVLLASAALTACATVDSSEESDRPADAQAPAPKAASPTASDALAPPPAKWEPWPPPGRADVARPAASGDVIELVCPEGGMRATDLLALVTKETGVALSYDSSPQGKIKTAKIDWTGTLRVPRSRLLDLCRAQLSFQALILVPMGPREATETWMVLDMASAMVKTRPTWIPEEEVFAYGDCDGLYVVTTLRIRDTVDPRQVRTALTPFATTTAGIGRVQDVVPARHLVVGDFAPVIAAMKRIVDEINRLAEPPPYPPPLRIPGAKPAGDAGK